MNLRRIGSYLFSIGILCAGCSAESTEDVAPEIANAIDTSVDERYLYSQSCTGGPNHLGETIFFSTVDPNFKCGDWCVKTCHNGITRYRGTMEFFPSGVDYRWNSWVCRCSM